MIVPEISFDVIDRECSYAKAAFVYGSIMPQDGELMFIGFRKYKSVHRIHTFYVHYPTDVLCGFLLGVLCGAAALLIAKAVKLENRLSNQ